VLEIDRHAIEADSIGITAVFFGGLLAHMACIAKGLESSLPVQSLITTVWNDMVHHGGSSACGMS
jgi:hypothetical protein